MMWVRYTNLFQFPGKMSGDEFEFYQHTPLGSLGKTWVETELVERSRLFSGWPLPMERMVSQKVVECGWWLARIRIKTPFKAHFNLINWSRCRIRSLRLRLRRTESPFYPILSHSELDFLAIPLPIKRELFYLQMHHPISSRVAVTDHCAPLG